MAELTEPSDSRAAARERRALERLQQMFEAAGWKVPGLGTADLIIRRGNESYAVEVKTAAEGRPDRLVPLWAQACLQVQRSAEGRGALAIVAAPRVATSTAETILEFAARYAPEAAAGVIDFEGLHRFRGAGLEALNTDEPPPSSSGRPLPGAKPTDLFTDLNQWMLKVLLAPALPEELLSAPRDRYRNASDLARAARVSTMTAYRFVHALRAEGYLDASSRYLTLVRRRSLFERWAASAARPVKEVPLRFLLAGDAKEETRRMLGMGPICLALFAAAEALGLGFVHGVPTHAYVPTLDANAVNRWKNAAPARPHERPDVVLRQAPDREAVFRGMVMRGEIPVCDILQTWLDVARHPSRGEEQAELIQHQVLDQLIDGEAV